MQIESIIRRVNGSFITLPNSDGTRTAYHFRPVNQLPGAAHVAEVVDPAHLSRLLAIPEGYRVYSPGARQDSDMPITGEPPATPFDKPGEGTLIAGAPRVKPSAPSAPLLREDRATALVKEEVTDDEGFSPAAVLEHRISDITPRFKDFTYAQLEELEAVEASSDGENRAGLLKAIDRELKSRGRRDEAPAESNRG
jgi:hypothetical protein